MYAGRMRVPADVAEGADAVGADLPPDLAAGAVAPNLAAGHGDVVVGAGGGASRGAASETSERE